jgi:hypothetical protein
MFSVIVKLIVAKKLLMPHFSLIVRVFICPVDITSIRVTWYRRFRDETYREMCRSVRLISICHPVMSFSLRSVLIALILLRHRVTRSCFSIMETSTVIINNGLCWDLWQGFIDQIGVPWRQPTLRYATSATMCLYQLRAHPWLIQHSMPRAMAKLVNWL